MRDIALGNRRIDSPSTENNLSPPMIKVLHNQPQVSHSAKMVKKGGGDKHTCMKLTGSYMTTVTPFTRLANGPKRLLALELLTNVIS